MQPRSYLWVKRTHTHVCLQQNEEAIFSHKTSWRASHDDPIILTCATTLVSHFSNNYGLHITIYCSYTANKNSRKCSRTAIFLCADSFCSSLLEKRPWRQIKKNLSNTNFWKLSYASLYRIRSNIGRFSCDNLSTPTMIFD